MRFTDLAPAFIRLTDPDGRSWEIVDSIAEAQGVEFKCPKCYAANGGPAGTHMVVCWSRSRGVPDHVSPGPGRWTLEGSGLADLTLGAEPNQTRSVWLTGPGCGWHGYITGGEASDA